LRPAGDALEYQTQYLVQALRFHFGIGEVEIEGLRQRELVGVVDEAEPYEVNKQKRNAEIAIEFTGAHPLFDNLAELLQERILGQSLVFLDVLTLFNILPQEQAGKQGVVVEELKIAFQEPGQFLAGILPTIHCMELDGFDVAVYLSQRGAEKLIFAAKIVVDHPLVHSGRSNNVVYGNAVVPVRCEEPDRCLEKPLPRPAGVAMKSLFNGYDTEEEG
jgi:hypothetical protein